MVLHEAGENSQINKEVEFETEEIAQQSPKDGKGTT